VVLRASPPATVKVGATVHPDHHEELVISLRAAARDLAQRRSLRDLEETLGRIVDAAVATIPGVEAGSISMAEHGRIETRHPTSDTIAKLDQTQSELHEGPCIVRSRTRPRAASSWPTTSAVRTPSGGRASPSMRWRPASGR
jgi:hypothetical protein